MPLKIPPVRPCYTARSKHGAENLRYFRENTSLNCAVNGYKPFKWEKVRSNVSVFHWITFTLFSMGLVQLFLQREKSKLYSCSTDGPLLSGLKPSSQGLFECAQDEPSVRFGNKAFQAMMRFC